MNNETRYNLLKSTANKLNKKKEGLFRMIEQRGMDWGTLMLRETLDGERRSVAATLNDHVGFLIAEIEKLEDEMSEIRTRQNQAFWGL